MAGFKRGNNPGDADDLLAALEEAQTLSETRWLIATVLKHATVLCVTVVGRIRFFL